MLLPEKLLTTGLDIDIRIFMKPRIVILLIILGLLIYGGVRFPLRLPRSHPVGALDDQKLEQFFKGNMPFGQLYIVTPQERRYFTIEPENALRLFQALSPLKKAASIMWGTENDPYCEFEFDYGDRRIPLTISAKNPQLEIISEGCTFTGGKSEPFKRLVQEITGNSLDPAKTPHRQ